MMNICEYCNSEFKSLQSLKRHKEITKYCLKLQGKITNIKENKIYNCEYCLKIFSNKNNLTVHYTCCKKKESEELKKENEKEIEKLRKENQKYIDELSKKDSLIIIFEEKQKNIDEEFCKLKKEKEKLELKLENYEENFKEKDNQIKDLQNRIERITNRAIDKPSLYNNTNNTKIISLQPFDLSKDYVTNKVMNKFNDNHILDGMSGIAKFVKDKIVTLEDGSLVYACFDTSRQMFKYKDKDGNVIKDPKSVKLIEMLQPALKEQTTNLYNFFENEIETYEENAENDTDTISMVDKMKFLKDSTLKIRVEINEMHENNKFSNELSSIIC